jgi:transcriptional regulator with XRE-family HTH domain
LTRKTLRAILEQMKLGEVIRRWRRNSDVGLREAAREIGVSHGTLSRIERGEEMDAKTLVKILAWLFSEAA